MSPTIHATLQQAFALRAEGAPREAMALCETILHLDPEQADAWHLLGLLQLEAGRGRDACKSIESAIARAPDMAAYHVNHATALSACCRLDDAVDALRRALSLDETIPEAHHNLGNTLLALGQSAEAEASFRRALDLNPEYAEAHNNLGHLRRSQGDSTTALAHFTRAAAARPDYAPAWTNLCGTLVETGQITDAIDAGRRAVFADPRSAEAFYNLGNAHAAVPDPVEAASCYRRATRINPAYVDAFANLGVALQQLGECDAAIAALDLALALCPDLPQANWNKAIAFLQDGRLREGWDLYEWRWQAVGELIEPTYTQPKWDGGPLDGRRILIRTEQGFGDIFQFIRYLPMVRALGAHVILEVPPALRRLMQSQSVADRVIASGDSQPDFDVWFPLMSLAKVFRTTLDTIPADCPYLRFDGAGPTMNERSGNASVGIVWRGSLTNDRGRFRSASLSDFGPLSGVADVTLFSLQTELSEEDRGALEKLPIRDLGSAFGDFADTAAAMRGMDLIVTVDTATAHLAGALGRPVWTLLSAIPDWRWMRDRADSPWYPTMRLFRQQQIGDWCPVIDAVTAALTSEI